MDHPHHVATEKLVKKLIYPFYQLERDMQLPIHDRPENDAEHSWSLAFAACALAPHIDPTLDIGKVSQFALVHDLVEVYAGDVSVFEEDDTAHENKVENEEQALEELRRDFSDIPWIYDTIAEYERKDTNEARYVWAMDKYLAFQMRLTYAQEFFEERGITKSFFDTSIARMRPKAHAHEGVGKLFDEIVAEFDRHPDWFVSETHS